MFKSDNFIFDEFLRGTGWTYAGDLLYTLTQIKDGSLSVQTDNSVDVTDAKGVRIETLKLGESGTFSANNALFSWGLLAAQSGGNRTEATAAAKITAPVCETFVMDGSGSTIVLTNTATGEAGKEIGSIIELNEDNTMKAKLTQGATAATGVFAFAPNTKTITFATAPAVGARFYVEYETEKETGFKITKDTITKNKQHKFRALALGHEPCDQNTQYAAWLVFPNAKLNNEITIDFAPDMDHPFELELAPGYCDGNKVLYEIYGDDTEWNGAAQNVGAGA